MRGGVHSAFSRVGRQGGGLLSIEEVFVGGLGTRV